MRALRPFSLAIAGTIAMALYVLLSVAGAQSGTVPTVLTLGSFGHAVQNLDVAVVFYRDGLGLDLVTPPSIATVDEARNKVMGTPGAKTRFARFGIPNEPFAIELVEYTGIDRKPTNPAHPDPGSSFLNVGYVDVAATYDALRKFHPKMVSKFNLPSASEPGGDSKVAWIHDPDGVMIELMHGGWDPMIKGYPYVRNAYRGHFGMTEGVTQSMTFYHDLLGFDVARGSGAGPAGPRPVTEGLASVVGIQTVGGTLEPVSGHCANARCETWDYENLPGGVTPFRPRLQDPGAVYLSVWVSDIDALMAKMKAANVEIVTQGGAPVMVDNSSRFDVVPVIAQKNATAGPARVKTSRQILVRDLSGFPVLLMQSNN